MKSHNYKANRWAALEEFDNAMGKILYTLNSLKRGSDTQSLLDKTLILVISDNGPQSPEGAYGGPDLMPGKGSTTEGGIRMGLLASACGNPIADAAMRLGSGVDLFATMAEAAGIPLDSSEVGNLLHSYNTGCNPSDPVSCRHYIDGKSFFGWLNGTGSTAHQRDFAFSHGDVSTIIQRPLSPNDTTPTNWPPGDVGVLGKKGVCGYIGEDAFSRPVYGSSCTPCSTNADCASLPNSSDSCKLTSFDGKLAITNSDCTKSSCNCHVCYPSSWKYRKDGGKERLYNLITNPQENAVGDCGKKPWLATDPALNLPPTKLTDILRDRLTQWKDCVSNLDIQAGSSGRCDELGRSF